MSHVKGGAKVCILALRILRVPPVAFAAVWGEVAMCPSFLGCASCMCPGARIYRTAWEFDLEVQGPPLSRCDRTSYPADCSVFVLEWDLDLGVLLQY